MGGVAGLRRPLTPANDRAHHVLKQSLPARRVKLLPISAEIALRAYEWPDDFHGDPADRIIAATAVIHALTLVTSDEKLLDRADLKSISTR